MNPGFPLNKNNRILFMGVTPSFSAVADWGLAVLAPTSDLAQGKKEKAMASA